MGRRSDHSRGELRELFLAAGRRELEKSGLAALSARAVARDVGYSVGTLYNVFGDLDSFILTVNTRTFGEWTDRLEAALAPCGDDPEARIAALVAAYFAFAADYTNAWLAIFDHRRPAGMDLIEAEVAERARLTAIVDAEVARFLGRPVGAETMRLTRSLIATVHGHCVLALGGSFALMGEGDPAGQALARVHEALAAQKS